MREEGLMGGEGGVGGAPRELPRQRGAGALARWWW